MFYQVAPVYRYEKVAGLKVPELGLENSIKIQTGVVLFKVRNMQPPTIIAEGGPWGYF